MATATYRKIVVREASERLAIRYTIDAHASDVNGARFSPDGTLLATVGEDGRVRLWRAADGEPVADLGTHASPGLLSGVFARRAVAGHRRRSRLIANLERGRAIGSATPASSGQSRFRRFRRPRDAPCRGTPMDESLPGTLRQEMCAGE